MSLLLEALKKAELAKQVAKADAPPSQPEAAPTAFEPAPRAFTREKKYVTKKKDKTRN